METELNEKTSLWISKEGLQAESAVIELLDFAAPRKQRYEMAMIALAQVLKAKSEGFATITISEINFKKIP